jgi:hypothetical protein
MQEEERGKADIKLDCMANTQLQASHYETLFFICNFHMKKNLTFHLKNIAGNRIRRQAFY